MDENESNIDLGELKGLTEKLIKIENETKSKRDLIEAMMDSLPHFAMIIDKDRNVLAANKIAKDVGAIVGGKCWSTFGKSAYITDEMKDKLIQKERHHIHKIDPETMHCKHCLGTEALDTGETQRELVIAFDKFWDTYWVPLDKNTYYHYAIDVTDWITKGYKE